MRCVKKPGFFHQTGCLPSPRKAGFLCCSFFFILYTEILDICFKSEAHLKS
ncbi:Uncharacterized protein dnm_006530 [Desulfonema magnum]|uniref:Uncharacterized protein n=1 Tax=Desulfonema magnum TaxID=45655 RepID=A0A975BG97_9BACT|nr:Uncharacterized protein dnm_006530 [Desulfonema magnum]